ncbi:FAD-dependent oxidoreductase [Spongiibacter sp. KMU-158]|uniref:FAD-dependent oxidoreductase n=1 Tax=Spongiibacter pelagi TaxID=2760804 RepID=A0A927C0W6_9GAMM|nr:FAD-dependent oxidoreductase [Spongiibacter pelagi]MBD2859198.1 FAD-dependent oxidoreductase [Spongiibacter pelagi]
MKRVAIIGSGISGLSAAYYLQRNYQVTLFEANDYLGGHTATVDVEVASGTYAIDTGFIVFNERTYPLFLGLLDEIGLAKQETEMSFSVSNRVSGFEYNGHNLNSLFCQRSNLIFPKFYRFIFEILRFNKLAIAASEQGVVSPDLRLGDFLDQHKFSEFFCQNYILPMIAAIWSSAIADARDFPLHFFLKFFVNHGLLQVANRPQWYVIPGGSRSYIPLLTRELSDIRLNTPVLAVERGDSGVQVLTPGHSEHFDEVIFACHSDQALAILGASANAKEKAILGAIPYRDNSVILHTDDRLLPRHRNGWASWNFMLAEAEDAPPSVTYNMNILQGIDSPETFCVSLNQDTLINPDKILGKYCYAHPHINATTIAAQQRRHEICGVQHTHFCGAYWYNGFHEDGLRSAVDVVKRLGVSI